MQGKLCHCKQCWLEQMNALRCDSLHTARPYSRQAVVSVRCFVAHMPFAKLRAVPHRVNLQKRLSLPLACAWKASTAKARACATSLRLYPAGPRQCSKHSHVHARAALLLCHKRHKSTSRALEPRLSGVARVTPCRAVALPVHLAGASRLQQAVNIRPLSPFKSAIMQLRQGVQISLWWLLVCLALRA